MADPNGNEANRARLQTATVVATRLKLATELLEQAAKGLEALRFGVEPALANARKALASARATEAQIDEFLRRIP